MKNKSSYQKLKDKHQLETKELLRIIKVLIKEPESSEVAMIKAKFNYAENRVNALTFGDKMKDIGFGLISQMTNHYEQPKHEKK